MVHAPTIAHSYVPSSYLVGLNTSLMLDKSVGHYSLMRDDEALRMSRVCLVSGFF